MLKVTVTGKKQNQQLLHPSGPLEFGRGLQRDVPRLQIDEDYVSRDQLRIEEMQDGRVRLENLSQKNPLRLGASDFLEVREQRELPLPVQLSIGRTQIQIANAANQSAATAAMRRQTVASPPSTPPEEEEDAIDQESLVALEPPALAAGAGLMRRPFREGETPQEGTLTLWLETIISLQQAAPDSPEFYKRVAQTMVDLIGLDMGLVLLLRDEKWAVAGSYVADSFVRMNYSRTLLRHVMAQRQTVYQDLSALATGAESLADAEAVVAAPIFGLKQDVVGALYGMRTRRTVERGGIRPLEAQLVQLLGAAAGANLARTLATQTRIQFEQFFSSELARELERDPGMLEGRNQEVTVLASDLRGFTRLAQRLGAEQSCEMMRALMGRLSERIIEHGGVIVDYAGDGILAMWNAPVRQQDHAARACRAALAMLDAMPGFNAEWQERTGAALVLGIGVNTGFAQVGNTGSTRKFKYGPHGHTVNLTSRVQDATGKLGLPVLITAATRDRLPGLFTTRRLGQVRLPGITEAISLYELAGEQCSPGWSGYRDTYEAALAQFESQQWAKACQTLMPLVEQTTQNDHFDRPTLKLMRRAWECLEAAPEPFDPVIEMLSK